MFVDDNLTEDSPDIDYEIIKQNHTNEEYREIIGEGLAEILGALRKGKQPMDGSWVCPYCGKKVYSMEVHPCTQPTCYKEEE